MNTGPMYEWYAELERYKPKMWRRFQTLGNITVARLGYTIMTLFEMQANHLIAIEHERPLFTPSGRLSQRTEMICRYDIPSDDEMVMGDDDDTGEDATVIQVSSLDLEAPSRLLVWYDFGDDWRVRVTREKVLDDSEASSNELPCVLKGAGFGIVEDCGGPFGLEELAEAFKKKKGKDYKRYCEWLDVDDLDLGAFDIDDMNFRLKKLPDIFAEIYERHSMPSQASIDIIERVYIKN